jgi:hypothetical protein
MALDFHDLIFRIEIEGKTKLLKCGSMQVGGVEGLEALESCGCGRSLVIVAWEAVGWKCSQSLSRCFLN